jgi:hypothetical protein
VEDAELTGREHVPEIPVGEALCDQLFESPAIVVLPEDETDPSEGRRVFEDRELASFAVELENIDEARSREAKDVLECYLP